MDVKFKESELKKDELDGRRYHFLYCYLLSVKGRAPNAWRSFVRFVNAVDTEKS